MLMKSDDFKEVKRYEEGIYLSLEGLCLLAKTFKYFFEFQFRGIGYQKITKVSNELFAKFAGQIVSNFDYSDGGHGTNFDLHYL